MKTTIYVSNTVHQRHDCIGFFYLVGICGRDRGLRHIPVVPGVSAQAPDLLVVGADAHVDVQVTDPAAVHVGPESANKHGK